MSKSIDLGFRPATYFGPQPQGRFLLGKVRTEMLRRTLASMLGQGRRDEVRRLLGDGGLSATEQAALERVHPMFMGGNYLPAMEDDEVEIARIAIDSTTNDVTCVYASRSEAFIRYRVVDEYGGDTLEGPSQLASAAPLTLGQLTDFFLTAWPLPEVLEMNFADDLHGQLGFFHATSDFYPEFDLLCRARVIAAHDRADRTQERG